MSTTNVACHCGAVELQLTGQPILQYYCHCDDCQAVHHGPFAVALYPATAVAVNGATTTFVLKTSPRTKCARCETHLFAESPGQPMRGVNGALLKGEFRPQFHVQCRFAREPIDDSLPHYKAWPARVGGSDEEMTR